MAKLGFYSVFAAFALFGIEFVPLAQVTPDSAATIAEFSKQITQLGAIVVLLAWLWDIRRDLVEERKSHERTRQKLEDVLKDCHRESDTRRIPMLPESEITAYRKMYLGDE